MLSFYDGIVVLAPWEYDWGAAQRVSAREFAVAVVADSWIKLSFTKSAKHSRLL